MNAVQFPLPVGIRSSVNEFVRRINGSTALTGQTIVITTQGGTRRLACLGLDSVGAYSAASIAFVEHCFTRFVYRNSRIDPPTSGAHQGSIKICSCRVIVDGGMVV